MNSAAIENVLLLADVDPGLTTYQLIIDLSSPCILEIGRLGRFPFPQGRYVYTGSARRHLGPRLKRHLSHRKNARWHIDYFLAHRRARIVDVICSLMPECRLNQQQRGDILVHRFGASDCREQCGSHFKYMSTL
ncbi:MAG: DUF123 domain-containing protein [Acidiferrobacterales bacterium]